MLAVHWPIVCCLLGAAIAAFTDLRTRTIPNWLVISLLCLGTVGHLAQGGMSALLVGLLGCLVCFLPCFLLFSRGALGGGDVKLFGCFGLLLGARDGLELQLTAFMLVTTFTVWCMAWNGKLLPLIRASYQATLHLVLPSRYARPEPTEGSHETPMGLAILIATLTCATRALP